MCVCVLDSGSEGRRGAADGERTRAAAALRGAADGKRGSGQRRSEILSHTESFDGTHSASKKASSSSSSLLQCKNSS